MAVADITIQPPALQFLLATEPQDDKDMTKKSRKPKEETVSAVVPTDYEGTIDDFCIILSRHGYEYADDIPASLWHEILEEVEGR